MILLTIHTLAMISLTVAALTHGSGEGIKCEYMIQLNNWWDHEVIAPKLQWFWLIHKFIAFLDIVFVGYVIGIAFLNSSSPLTYELLAEISHPVPEDIINGLCNQCNNIFGALFYFTFR